MVVQALAGARNLFAHIDVGTWQYFLGERSTTATELLLPLSKAYGFNILGLVLTALALVLIVARARAGTKPVWLPLFLPLSVGAAALGTSLLKRVIERPRPPVEWHMVDEHTFSMPSGHATAGFAVALAFSLYFRHWWTVIMWLIAPVVAMSRLYLGVHWLTDVLIGSMVGLCVVALAWFGVVARVAGDRTPVKDN